jgi:NADPH-dependent 2,4-dienoyl-CoA reductase/sulfur reductase-like enzyme/nitrite reductase/ring-hydroxylating ferredoxin subunit
MQVNGSRQGDDLSSPESTAGPDLRTAGFALADIPEGGMARGVVDGEPALLLRAGGRIVAMGGKCTHYGGPLAEGIFDGELVRCPWHHACFRPETGEAVRAPAFDPAPTWTVEVRDGRAFVAGAARSATPASANAPARPASVVILGGGAAGFAAAEMLRREGYDGPVTLVSDDDAPPYDRPNASKDYLAGNAPEKWMPLRPADWYREKKIEIVPGVRAVELAPAEKTIALAGGGRLEYGALLLATGASPVRLEIPGADRGKVRTLRSLSDSRTIIRDAEDAKRAVVVGASFIGLEVAASLVHRGLEVHVVAPDAVPMERVLGREVGETVRALHEERGVRFHLGETVAEVFGDAVRLKGGERLPADLVVLGVGVRPNTEIAERAGLAVDRGVVVDQYLATSAAGIWAAGDIARWPDPHTGRSIRVEHWVVAERQGQAAARNILGRRERFEAVPFFWSQHYDVALNYVGHAETWDSVEIAGGLPERNAAVAYRKNGSVLAVVTLGRDRTSLEAEVAMERDDGGALDAALAASRRA